MGHKQRYFRKVHFGGVPLWDLTRAYKRRDNARLEMVLRILEYVHIYYGLLEAYNPTYPLVEPRELIPAFDAPLIEYKNLPAFGMVVFDRTLSYQDEGFQFDLLHHEGTPFDPSLAALNRQILRERLPRDQVPELDKEIGRKALTDLGRYTQLLPHLAKMDRGHVISRDLEGMFWLTGIFASFPSDLDGEIKRLGKQIGKFQQGDNELYAENRRFVYRFLMEQSGFPICGERHTSAALFARRLMRRRERFFVKVLGQSDRAVTTLTNVEAKGRLPRVEKVALVAAESCSRENRRRIAEEGYFLDKKRSAVILKVHYAHHSYHPDNVLEDRALSVASQEIIHPQTGQSLSLDVLGISQDRLLMLNDIVRGEFEGSIVYRERERVQGTKEIEKRLMFLSAWLEKHHHLLAEYSPDNFERTTKVVSSFVNDRAYQAELKKLPELVKEVKDATADLRVAHRLRLLEKLVENRSDASGRRLGHQHILTILAHFLSQEGGELAFYHPRSMNKLLSICRKQLTNPYLHRRYLSQSPRNDREREMVEEYNWLSVLVDRFETQNSLD
ncbi:MAG: hypothetical protein PVG03_03775 [Desulfarculaceae bacterium]|jgi:hypothetical protein